MEKNLEKKGQKKSSGEKSSEKVLKKCKAIGSKKLCHQVNL
jgi:ribosomal protein L32